MDDIAAVVGMDWSDSEVAAPTNESTKTNKIKKNSNILRKKQLQSQHYFNKEFSWNTTTWTTTLEVGVTVDLTVLPGWTNPLDIGALKPPIIPKKEDEIENLNVNVISKMNQLNTV